MTREEILSNNSNRGLSAEVAEKVMGWTVFRGEWNNFELLEDEFAQGFPPSEEVEGVPFEIPEYSSDIALAWEVYMEMMKGYFSQRKRFYDELQLMTRSDYGLTAYPDVFTALRNDMPRSICRAALLTKIKNDK